MRELIWNSMLTAQMSACYWNSLARRYNGREKCLKIFLAVTASGAVAGWTIWAHYDIVGEQVRAGPSRLRTIVGTD